MQATDVATILRPQSPYIIIIITECRGCSAKQKAFWSLYIVKDVNGEFHKLHVKSDTADN